MLFTTHWFTKQLCNNTLSHSTSATVLVVVITYCLVDDRNIIYVHAPEDDKPSVISKLLKVVVCLVLLAQLFLVVVSSFTVSVGRNRISMYACARS
jgi:hypothetical protein